MPPPQPQRIAVASTFSPRFEMVLAEAKRVRDRLGSQLHLIYVGERDAETDRRFGTALAELDLPADSVIHYQQGNPADAILAVTAAQGVELIVAGALEKQAVLRQFLGNVARRLVREAACSVFLFTKPERVPLPLRTIVFYVPEFSEHTARAFQRTLWLAAQEGCEHLHVIRVYTSFDAARAGLRANPEVEEVADQPVARTLEEEETALDAWIEAAGETSVPMEGRCIRGNTGFAASDFVQSVAADLLVVPVEVTPDSDGLPSHIAWVTDVIPCNLWVIR